ncbi:bacteriophage/transposase fusion protein [Burkholderia pseudomallei]|uniref:SPFH domain-containing protein n=20 Tax=Burkholderia pseudomallei TaxID=28450 RepID=UPI000F15ED95|nr:SPFH domain-containing protein [Burkholderia pseudomallei]CAJ4097182.1 bacteriophage/transposase fusion protein [Burkholderia pseudomallei]VBQ02599.1 bacteriophage/transposase fusion protein [Burkholderia pseudomallei]
MKRLFLILILAPTMFLAAGCDNVPAGYVGVKVQRYGDDRGVNVEVKGPGRYFNGPNVDMFIFPTFTQSYVWDKAGKSDESFTFQTVEGLSVNTDIGVSYAIPRENAPKVFQKYRRGVDEITGVYLRAIVRDALNLAGASMAVEDVYGRGKAALQQRVEDEVKANAAKVGISVEKVYFVNQMRLPEQVMNSINLRFGSGRFVKTCLRQIARQLIEQDCMVRKAFTSVYWTPQDSRYYSIVFYDKGEDVRRKCLPKAKRAGDEEQEFFEALCNECDGLLRIEVRLKSAELKKQGLQSVKAWSGEAPKGIFNRYYRNVPVLNVVSSGMSRADFDGVPDRLRPVIALSKLNAPMELVYSDRTLARHRSAFRKLQIDLKSPARAKAVPLAKLLTASRIKPTPPWLADARFAPLPNEASESPSPVKSGVSRIA